MKTLRQRFVTFLKMILDRILSVTLRNCTHWLLEKIPIQISDSVWDNPLRKTFNQLLESLMTGTMRKIIIKIIRQFRNKIRSANQHQNIGHDSVIRYLRTFRFTIMIRLIRLINQLKTMEMLRINDLEQKESEMHRTKSMGDQ
jgi:hypothetical protein